MINTKIEVDNVEFNDYQRMRVNQSMNEYNSSSTFQVTYDSPFGRHSTDFQVGNEIELFADDSDATTKLLTGVVERVNFRGRENTQTVTLSGRDFSLRLQDATVDPIIFTDTEISEIVTSIISANVDDITTTNVDTTGVTLKRIVFNHTPVFEALKQLAELAGFYFFVDNDKDLNFKQRANVSSGIVLDNTNINISNIDTTREGMANSVFVYGDRQLSGFEETLTAGSPLGGSVFDLLSKPRNTLVTVDTVPSQGGVFELTVVPTSGPRHLVSFNDKKVVFVSGTDIGYDAIPSSGASVKITYDRDIPIVKFGQNEDSITLFGKREKIINDKSINDPNTAVDILRKELEKSDPFKGVECATKGWFSITPGTLARVTLSDFNIDEDVGILNASYIFDKTTVNNEKIITVRLDRKITDITDEITTIRNRLNAIESADRQESDTITSLRTSEDNVIVVGSKWEVKTRTELGSSFILGVAPHGVSGPTFGGTLGSIVASGINFLGDSRGALSIVASGGFYD